MARGGRATASWAGAIVAIVLHVGLGAAALTIDPARFRAETPIEIDIEEKLPPPEVKPPPPEPERPPPERPKLAVKRPAVATPPTPPPAPPPPNEATPKANDTPPVFGVSMSSVVSGDGPGMAVPVGNTLMTKPGKPAPKEIPAASGDGTKTFSPVAEMYIATYPEKLFEVNSDDIYPADAKRMGIEGVVTFKIGVDEKGDVADVRIVERAGHGFDEAAAKAMRRFKFKPAIANDGRPVPCRISYTFRFNLTQ
jgi:protein TonB